MPICHATAPRAPAPGSSGASRISPAASALYRKGCRQPGQHRLGEGGADRLRAGIAPHMHDQRLLPRPRLPVLVVIHRQQEMRPLRIEVEELAVDMDGLAVMAVA